MTLPSVLCASRQALSPFCTTSARSSAPIMTTFLILGLLKPTDSTSVATMIFVLRPMRSTVSSQQHVGEQEWICTTSSVCKCLTAALSCFLHRSVSHLPRGLGGPLTLMRASSGALIVYLEQTQGMFPCLPLARRQTEPQTAGLGHGSSFCAGEIGA